MIWGFILSTKNKSVYDFFSLNKMAKIPQEEEEDGIEEECRQEEEEEF